MHSSLKLLGFFFLFFFKQDKLNTIYLRRHQKERKIDKQIVNEQQKLSMTFELEIISNLSPCSQTKSQETFSTKELIVNFFPFLFSGYFPLESVHCLVWMCLDVLFCTASIMHLCSISIDRYLSLRYPMRFGRNKTRKRVTVKIVFVWLLSIAMSLPLCLMYSKVSEISTIKWPIIAVKNVKLK